MSDYIELEEDTGTEAELEVSEAVIEAVSPRVSTEAITGGHRVTVTDIDGEKTFDVMDGEPGEDGDDYVLTEADKAEIASLVLADLPTWTGGAY